LKAAHAFMSVRMSLRIGEESECRTKAEHHSGAECGW